MCKRYFMLNTKNNQWYTFTDTDRKDRQLFKDSENKVYYKNKGYNYLSNDEVKQLEQGINQFL